MRGSSQRLGQSQTYLCHFACNPEHIFLVHTPVLIKFPTALLKLQEYLPIKVLSSTKNKTHTRVLLLIMIHCMITLYISKYSTLTLFYLPCMYRCAYIKTALRKSFRVFTYLLHSWRVARILFLLLILVYLECVTFFHDVCVM